MSDAAIEVAGLRKRFGSTVALDGMTFTVPRGQVTGFVGPNGAGKSTTMRVILGLDAPDAGQTLVGGRTYLSLRRPLTQVGALLDAGALQPSRTARNHLLWLAHSQGLDGRRVDEVIALTGLASAARRKAGGYSLGMRQRLGIAAALLGDPPVLMLDEPFNGMDPEGIVWMRGFLSALAVQGRAVLVSSHLMGELQESATHLVIVGRGRVIADTSVAALLAAAAGDRVSIKTSAKVQAAAVLRTAGAAVAEVGDGYLTASGLPAERLVALLATAGVPFSEVSAHRASLEEAYMELTRDAVEYRAGPARCHCRVRYPACCGGGGCAMTTVAARDSGPAAAARADSFMLLLRSEWTKFRTVRGWVIAALVAALLTVLVGVLTGADSHDDCSAGPCHFTMATGPAGTAVTDTFYFVHRALTGDGSITVRVTSLTAVADSGLTPQGPAQTQPALVPWSKAGIILTGSQRQGAPYAAMLVTGSHGSRMQWNYTGDAAGLGGRVSAASPRWLRLTRSGDAITGYDSATGSHWTKLSTVRLPGLPTVVEAGLFATSPAAAVQVSGGLTGASGTSYPTQATGAFDRLALSGHWAAGSWTGTAVNGGRRSLSYPAVSPGDFRQAGGVFTLTGTGDIAPGVDGGAAADGTLAGVFIALISIIVVGALFMTAEYRRGLIRVTFAASPHRSRVLAAKAIVLGSVAFAAGLAGSAGAIGLGVPLLRANGNPILPASMATDVRVIAGTAALVAVIAVLALAAGTILRSGAAAVTVVIAAVILPYLLGAAFPVLPAGAADWLLRVTPAAGFAIRQVIPQYPQVTGSYTPFQGYFPLAPWAGLAVTCGWALLALALAGFVVRRRDA